MKNIIKNIVIIILVIVLFISVMLHMANTTSITQDDPTSYFENINHQIINSDYEITEYEQSELNLYTDLSSENLAVLVSNKDYPVEFIDLVAKNHGYVGYTDMCDKLIKTGLLVYIPEYEHPKHGMLAETIVTTDTVGYELAVEAGIIEEVK